MRILEDFDVRGFVIGRKGCWIAREAGAKEPVVAKHIDCFAPLREAHLTRIILEREFIYDKRAPRGEQDKHHSNQTCDDRRISRFSIEDSGERQCCYHSHDGGLGLRQNDGDGGEQKDERPEETFPFCDFKNRDDGDWSQKQSKSVGIIEYGCDSALDVPWDWDSVASEPLNQSNQRKKERADSQRFEYVIG